jgi:hypothetical protein
MQLHGDDGGSGPVRSPRTHVQPRGGQDVDEAQSSLLSETDPIQLTDIDRLLEDSAALAGAVQADAVQADAPADTAGAVRVWRQELSVALESLSYARSVLADDVGILRYCLENESTDAKSLVDELPRLVAGPQTRGQGSSPRTEGSARYRNSSGADADMHLDDADWTVCIRSDQLMTAHEEMARADLSSAEDVTRVLRELEEQLSDLARRQDAVEGRLHQVRQAILGQYERGTVTARDWLG